MRIQTDLQVKRGFDTYLVVFGIRRFWPKINIFRFLPQSTQNFRPIILMSISWPYDKVSLKIVIFDQKSLEMTINTIFGQKRGSKNRTVLYRIVSKRKKP